MDTVDRNVVVLPSPEVIKQSIAWSRDIAAKLKTKFVLDGMHLHPHLSLYQARYPARNEYRVVEAVRQIVLATMPFTIEMDGFSAFAGVIFYDAVCNARLQELHETLVRASNPLREALLLPVHEALLGRADVSSTKQVSIREWGNPMCMENFDPHVSLTRMADYQEAPDGIALLSGRRIAFDVEELAVTEIGQDGTCPRLIEVLPLGRQAAPLN